MARAKRWCFTLNNFTPAELTALQNHGEGITDNSTFSYLVLGREVGQGGTPHLQGFFCLRSQLRLRSVKALGGLGRAHLEIARGSPGQASAYCKKDGDFDEYGELPGGTQGRRTDFEELRDWIKAQDPAPSLRDVGENFPHLLGRYPGAVRQFIDLYGKRPTLVGGPVRNWQQRLINVINGDPDDRHVIFVVDPDGKKGKSWLTRYWYSTRDDIQTLSTGKQADLAFALDTTKRLFVFDVPRGSMEYLQYSILEQLKNQMVFSSKYESQTKIWPTPVHVVVFCNELPDMDKMTDDRYEIFDDFT